MRASEKNGLWVDGVMPWLDRVSRQRRGTDSGRSPCRRTRDAWTRRARVARSRAAVPVNGNIARTGQPVNGLVTLRRQGGCPNRQGLSVILLVDFKSG